MTDDEPQDVRARRAEREADADLLRPAADQIREHAVNADRRERERERAERAEQRHVQARLLGRLSHVLVHREHAEHRDLRIDGRDRAADGRRELLRLERRADEQRHGRAAVAEPDRQLLERDVHLEVVRLADEPVMTHVPDDASQTP